MRYIPFSCRQTCTCVLFLYSLTCEGKDGRIDALSNKRRLSLTYALLLHGDTFTRRGYGSKEVPSEIVLRAGIHLPTCLRLLCVSTIVCTSVENYRKLWSGQQSGVQNLSGEVPYALWRCIVQNLYFFRLQYQNNPCLAHKTAAMNCISISVY